MRTVLFIFGLLLTFQLDAQVVVTPSVSTYPFPVLTGSTRQIYANITTGNVSGTRISYGGQGYVTGDINSYLTILQSGSSNSATVKITSVSGGAVTGVALVPTVIGTGYTTVGANFPTTLTNPTPSASTVSSGSVATWTFNAPQDETYGTVSVAVGAGSPFTINVTASSGGSIATLAGRLNGIAGWTAAGLVATYSANTLTVTGPYGASGSATLVVSPSAILDIHGALTSGGSGTGATVLLSTQCTVANGYGCTMNWTAAVSGGASATFSDQTHTAVSSISGGLATITVNIGGTGAVCSITGSIGSYVFGSTSTVTVTAQSTDNTGSTATFSFNVCTNQSGTLANGEASVRVTPFYDQVYPSEPVDLTSFVSGCVDETGVWAITAFNGGSPSGGNGVLSDTTFRDSVFSASTSGEYTVQYTANCNGGTQIATIYVVPSAAPSYTATPNETKPVACAADPNLTGPVYDIGAGHTYASIGATPPFATVSAGTTYMLYNTDTTGSNPSTYAEYFQIGVSGTRTNPINFCGVPDSLGNLPIMTGANAVGQSSISPSGSAVPGYGLLSIYPAGAHYNYWQAGSAGPKFIRIAGISFQNANPNTTYTQPGGVSATCPSGLPAPTGTTCAWLGFTSAMQARSGTDIVLTGNESNNVGLGVFTDNNSSNAWGTMTQNISIDGNNFHNCGWVNEGVHCLYLQTLYIVVSGNRIGPGAYTSGSGPSGLKFRGQELIARYNIFVGPLVRDFDLVDDQDGIQWISMDSYLGPVGTSQCDLSFWCDGNTASAGVIAGYFEAGQKDFAYGNIMAYSTGGQVHYGYDDSPGLADRNGTLYFYNNTDPYAASVFDTGFAQGGIFYGRLDVRNSILWPYSGSTIPSLTLKIDQILSGTTNLFETSSISITTPIVGGNAVGKSLGWANGASGPYYCNGSNNNPCSWPLANPMNTHLPGLGGTNYLFTSTQPFNSTTFNPPAGSAAIGAGTALTGLPAQLPVRFQYQVNTGSLGPRIYPLTIGAVENSPGPSLVSIAITCPATLGVGQNAYCSAQCTYSDFSVVTCTGSATWTSSNTSAATVATYGFLTGVSASVGTTTISASSGSVNSNNQTLTVTIVPGWIGTGAPCDAGQCVIN